MASVEPPTKKAKTEEIVAEEEPAAGETAEATTKKIVKPEKAAPAPELETDAPKAKGEKIKDHVGFLVQDTTLNVADSMFGNMLTCLSDGGMQFLLAGARANVGMKSGRYMFEVNVVELMHQKQDTAAATGRVPQPRNFFRVGLSIAGSSLLIGEDEDSVCFDAEGCFIHNKKKTQVGAKFERSMFVCVLVNLDDGSPNANTVSMFRDGERMCQPQALPDHLKGKALFPTITFRNVTVHYNFGPVPEADLPFTCRTLQDASAKDVATTADVTAKDGKNVAVFPCCLPDEGAFQWLDAWLKENPGYTELSDRSVLDWAQKSGIARLKPYSSMVCKDKPEMSFGLPLMDDKSIQQIISYTAVMQKRNFVIMEVHANLMKEDRTKLVASFDGFKKVAMVLSGEPPSKFKKLAQDAILTEKQEAADEQHKKKCEQARKLRELAQKKKEQAKKQKQAEKAYALLLEEKKKAAKKAAEERKKKLVEALKKKEEEKKKKAEEAKAKVQKILKQAEDELAEAEGKAPEKEGADVEMEDAKKEDEVKEEAKEEEVKEEAKEEEEESEDEPMEVEDADPEPPVATLSDEEKKLWVKPSTTPDVTAATLNAGFAKYSFPDKSEGFDEVKYEWQPAAKAVEHLSSWRQEKKVTALVDDLVIGAWFDTKQKEWSKFLQLCKQKQNDHKAQVAKRAAEKAAKEKMKQMKELQLKAKAIQDQKIAEAKKKMAEAKVAEKVAKAEAKEKAKAKKLEARAEAEAAAAAKGETLEPEAEEVEEEEEVEVEEPEPMEVAEEKAEEPVEEPEVEDTVVDLESLDVFGVADIFETGGVNHPLFANFAFEDWALMSLRFELNLLVHTFKKDVKDPERSLIHEDNIAHYYQKYFRKSLNTAFFGVKTVKELLAYFSDTLIITKKTLETFLPAEQDSFNVYVLLAEGSRRDRQRRVDMGEEGAKISMQTSNLGGWAPGVMVGMGPARPGQLTPSVVMGGKPVAPMSFAARPAGAMAGAVAMVRPPAQAWGQQQAWRPQAAGAWAGVRPAYGAVRPAFGAFSTVAPAWR